jgi:hypothetical protein
MIKTRLRLHYPRQKSRHSKRVLRIQYKKHPVEVELNVVSISIGLACITSPFGKIKRVLAVMVEVVKLLHIQPKRQSYMIVLMRKKKQANS